MNTYFQHRDAKTRRIAKAYGASLCAAIFTLSLIVCHYRMASAMPPMFPKPLPERVKLASHIFVGTATNLWVTDEKGRRIYPEPEFLKLGLGAFATVEVNEVLRPQGWKAKTNVVIQLSGGFYSPRQLRSYLMDKRLIYLTVTDGTIFHASYGSNWTEPLDKKTEIEELVKGQSK